MNKAPLFLSESIRTIASDKLLRTFSLQRMYNNLIDLFVDRTSIDTSLLGRIDFDVDKWNKYNDCLHMNDKETIAFNNRLPQSDDVFDEVSGNYYPSNLDFNNNMFIPFDSGDAE